MSAVLIAQLLATFGPSAIQLIDTLIAQIQNKGDVTPAQWASLSAALKSNAADEMTKVLQAQGIDPASPQGQALLALVK